MANIENEIQKKLLGERKDQLTAHELHDLFQQPITPEFIFVLYLALKGNAIDPSITLLQAITNAHSKAYLIPIALCLRYGADSGMYVNDHKLGYIHLLGFVYARLAGDKFSDDDDLVADTAIINTIILMLLVSGSRPASIIFDKTAGKVQHEIDITPVTTLTVTEWLNEKGYNTILNKVNIGDSSTMRKVVDADSMNIISILMDSPDVRGRDFEERDKSLSIRAFADKCFDMIPTPNNKILGDYRSLLESVNHLNVQAFKKLLNKDQVPSYAMMNHIINKMKTYKDRGEILAMQACEEMLLLAIDVGVQLDQDQMAIISTLGANTLVVVNKQYGKPYWEKICSNPSIHSENPDIMKRLAISLDIDPSISKQAMCDRIVHMSKTDKESLKEAARKRQKLRMASELGLLNEFERNELPSLTCRNASQLEHDPFDYNELDIAYYRDEQGAIWCFSSDRFKTILEGGINPYNMTKLPPSFIDELRWRIDELKKLGIDASAVGVYESRTPVTFSKAIDDLYNKDTTSERYSSSAVENLIQLGAKHNITAETIRNLDKEKMIRALRSIDNEVDLTSLSTQHSLVTVARVIEEVNRRNPDSVTIFFRSINVPPR